MAQREELILVQVANGSADLRGLLIERKEIAPIRSIWVENEAIIVEVIHSHLS
jgi:hypothetical protein